MPREGQRTRRLSGGARTATNNYVESGEERERDRLVVADERLYNVRSLFPTEQTFDGRASCARVYGSVGVSLCV